MNRFDKAEDFSLATGGFRFEIGDDGDLCVTAGTSEAAKKLQDLSRLDEWPDVDMTTLGAGVEMWLSDPDDEGWGAVINRFFEALETLERPAARFKVLQVTERAGYVVDTTAPSATGDGSLADGFTASYPIDLAKAIVDAANAAEENPDGALAEWFDSTKVAMEAYARLYLMMPEDTAELYRATPAQLEGLAITAGAAAGALSRAARTKRLLADAVVQLLDRAEGAS